MSGCPHPQSVTRWTRRIFDLCPLHVHLGDGKLVQIFYGDFPVRYVTASVCHTVHVRIVYQSESFHFMLIMLLNHFYTSEFTCMYIYIRILFMGVGSNFQCQNRRKYTVHVHVHVKVAQYSYMYVHVCTCIYRTMYVSRSYMYMCTYSIKYQYMYMYM